LLDLAAGAEAMGRHYVYDNGISTSPYTYRLTAAPAVRVNGSVYPLAMTGKIWGDLGLTFDYARVFVATSELGGARSGTIPTSWGVGLRGRLRIGPPRVVVGASVGYAASYFGVAGPANAELPAVDYRSVRPAIDVRLLLGPVSILGEGAFRAIVDPSAVSSRFLTPHGFGFDGNLGVGWLFLRHLEARLVGRYERYAVSFAAPPNTILRAGSITDQWYGARLALALLF
jgi:hypothetical protein